MVSLNLVGIAWTDHQLIVDRKFRIQPTLTLSLFCVYLIRIKIPSMNKFLKTLLFLCVALLSGNSHAILIDRGGNMVYDTDLNVTWIADFDFFRTQAISDPNLIYKLISNTPQDSIAKSIYSSYRTYGGAGSYALANVDFNVGTSDSLSTLSWYGTEAWLNQLEYRGYSDWRIAGKPVWIDGMYTVPVHIFGSLKSSHSPLTPVPTVCRHDPSTTFRNGGMWITDCISLSHTIPILITMC